MPTFPMGVAPDFTVGLVYNAGNGRVTGLEVSNGTGRNMYAEAKLDDGRVFGQVFAPGALTINIPNNVVTISFDANGEPIFTGLHSVSSRGV